MHPARRLADAAHHGDVVLLEALLERGVPKEGTETPALVLAASAGQEKAVWLLLEHGANAERSDGTGRTALISAARAGHHGCVKALLQYGASTRAADRDGMTPMLAAARAGDAPSVAALLAAGARAKRVRATMSDLQPALDAWSRGLPDLKCLRDAMDRKISPMLVAVLIGAGDVIARLLEHDASLASGGCLLRLAAAMGDADAVALLLDAGARDDDLEAHATGGATAGEASCASDADAPTPSDSRDPSSSSDGSLDIAAQCTASPAGIAGFDASRLPFRASVYSCAARNRTHGGVAVIRDFLSPSELANFTSFVQLVLTARFGRVDTPDQGGVAGAPNDTYTRTLIYWPPRSSSYATQATHRPYVNLLAAIGTRLRSLPGAPPPLPDHATVRGSAHADGFEQLHVHAYRSKRRRVPLDADYYRVNHSPTERTGRLGSLWAMHQDRNAGLDRFATAILYLGERPRSPADGGHTIFPLLDVPGSAPSEAAVSARQLLRQLVEGSAAIGATDDASAPRRWSSPKAQAALRTLCEEAIQAAEVGRPPPCLAVAPTPGTASVIWNWAELDARKGEPVGERLAPEWSTVHTGCPAYGMPKLTVQSFRVLGQ